jgi:hypothetical protein
MSIEDTIAADQATVTADQTALDAATATLTADQSKLAAIQPHLDLIDKLEADMAAIEAGTDATVASAFDALKASVEPFIAQMRALFTS